MYLQIYVTYKHNKVKSKSINIYNKDNKHKNNNVRMTAVDLKALPWQHVNPSSIILETEME